MLRSPFQCLSGVQGTVSFFLKKKGVNVQALAMRFLGILMPSWWKVWCSWKGFFAPVSSLGWGFFDFLKNIFSNHRPLPSSRLPAQAWPLSPPRHMHTKAYCLALTGRCVRWVVSLPSQRGHPQSWSWSRGGSSQCVPKQVLNSRNTARAKVMLSLCTARTAHCLKASTLNSKNHIFSALHKHYTLSQVQDTASQLISSMFTL